MPHANDKPLPAASITWIDEADDPAALKIIDDGNTLPRICEEQPWA